MNLKTISAIVFLTMSPLFVYAQSGNQEKGIDTQTRSIRDGSKSTDKGNDVSRSWSWDGKTKIRGKYENPYPLNGRRDILIETIVDILKDEKMIVDEAASRFTDGLVVTEPFVFSKGPILTRTELMRYADVPDTDQVWTRGRFTLTIELRSLDGIRNRLFVTAKVEGRSENGLFSEWSTLESSGVAEDEFISKLASFMGTGEDDDKVRRP